MLMLPVSACVMRADAWHPLRYRAEIYEGVGHAYLVPARS